MRRREFVYGTASLWGRAAGQKPAARDLPPFRDIGFIDHHNLRYPDQDERKLGAQVAEVRTNMAKAGGYGVRHYVLFSRAFESLINYDFEVTGIGNIGAAAFPAGSPHRAEAARYGKALRACLQAARQNGIRALFHTNQFEFPREVYGRFGAKMKGTAPVCPGKPFVWELLRGKIREFFTKFPECAGLQLTADETQVSALACRCEDCRNMGPGERIDRLVRETAAVCSEFGKEMQARTWGRVGELVEERGPGSMFDRLPKGVVVSIKHTHGDFYLGEPASELIGFGDDRQVVEFDSWGEYCGWNNFPCYLGDVFAARLRLTAEKGVRRVASRLCWNPFVNPIFERTWGNEVNLHVFARLAQNPSLDADSVLREWIARHYKAEAREPAFRLYKRSAELQATWLNCSGRNANDHSRIYHRPESTFARARSSMRGLLASGYISQPDNVQKRRNAIDAAIAEARQLIAALGPECPEDWRRDMLRGAMTEWRVAHGVTDQMELLRAGLAIEKGERPQNFAVLGNGIRRRLDEWRRSDPAGVETYNGEAPSIMLREVQAMTAKG